MTDRQPAWRWAQWVFIIIAAFCTVDLLMVIFGRGVLIRFAGLELRSTTIEFPVVALLLSSLLALCAGGKWKEALLLSTALILAAGLGEALLRVVDHPLTRRRMDYYFWYQPSSYYGHELAANYDGLGPLNVPVKINADGFRDTAHPKEKPPGTARILGVGDSFVFGWGVQPDEAFLKRLESKLSHLTGRAVETINAGVPAWGLNQYYLYLKRDGMQFSPDLVILAYFADDMTGPAADSIPPATQFANPLQYKGSQSRLFNLLKLTSHLIREKNRATAVAYLHSLDARRTEFSQRPFYMSQSSPEAEQYASMLLAHLTRLKTLVEKGGSDLIIMYVPDISQLHHPETQLINRTLSDSCKKLLIPFVDMTPVFEQSRDPGRYYLWPQDSHANQAGYEEMATALVPIICALPQWKAACKP